MFLLSEGHPLFTLTGKWLPVRMSFLYPAITEFLYAMSTGMNMARFEKGACTSISASAVDA